jgi:hypothetical protein
MVAAITGDLPAYITDKSPEAGSGADPGRSPAMSTATPGIRCERGDGGDDRTATSGKHDEESGRRENFAIKARSEFKVAASGGFSHGAFQQASA